MQAKSIGVYSHLQKIGHIPAKVEAEKQKEYVEKIWKFVKKEGLIREVL
jgi:hypothetical protein